MAKLTNFLLCLSVLIGTATLRSHAQNNSIPMKWNEKAAALKTQQDSKNLPAKAPTIDANGAVTEPAGEKLDFSQSYYMVDAWGVSAVGGEKAEIYYDKDNATVYIKKLFEDYMGECYYAQGKIVEGDLENGVVEFSTEAPMYYCYGTLLYIGIAEINSAQDGFNYLEGCNSFKFYIKDGVWTCPDCLALLDKNDVEGGFYWVQYDYRYIPVNLEEMIPVTTPAGAESSHYFSSNDGTNLGIVKIYRDGDDFYFNNVFGYGYTFKGSLTANNTLEVEVPQLVSADNYFIYLNASDANGNPKNVDKITFEYDPKSGDIYDSSGILALFSGNRFLYGNLMYGNLEFLKFLPEEEPVEIPEGVEQKRYFMSTGYDLQGNHKAGLMKIAKDGNDIYFMKVDNSSYDVIMKGVLDPSDNTVTIDLNQIIGVNGSRFLGLAAAKQYIVEVEDAYDDPYNEIRYTIDEDKSTVTMHYDPATEIYTCDDVLAVIDAQRRVLSFSFITPTYSPVNEPYVVPFNAVIDEYVFTPEGEANNAKVVKIARDGDDFYFIHSSDRIFYGKLTEDGKVTVAIPQTIGYGTNEQGVFLRVGSTERVYTPDDVDLQVRSWKQWTDDEGVNQLVFDFNEGLNTFSCDNKFSFVTLSNGYELETASGFTYETYRKGLFTPADPTDLELADKKEDYWGNQQRFCFSFVIPCKDSDGKYLPYDNISYSIYFDDEVFAFTPAEYPKTFTVEVTEVPFNHPATTEITAAAWNDNMRRVYLYSLPENKLGVQSIYTYGGEQKRSAIVYVDIEQTGLSAASLKASLPIDVQYYDLSSRRVSKPSHGMYIKKTMYENGTSASEKCMVNQE